MLQVKKFGWLFTISLIVVLAINFIAGQGKLDKVVAQQPGGNQEKLVMVTSADYPPYEFRDTARGNAIIGFDVDIANRIAKELGFQLQIIDTDFNGIIPALQSGRADFAMAGMTPTEERQKNVDFSDIYYEAKNTIVAKKGSNLKKPEDLAGKNVGVQLGSTQEEAAQKFKDVKLVSLNKTAEIIQEVKAGRIQAAIIEDTIAKDL
jgi:polar amino acid transport system substrate-binding protein